MKQEQIIPLFYVTFIFAFNLTLFSLSMQVDMSVFVIICLSVPPAL